MKKLLFLLTVALLFVTVTEGFAASYDTGTLEMINARADENGQFILDTGFLATDPDNIVIPFTQEVRVTFLYEGAGHVSDFGWMLYEDAVDADGNFRGWNNIPAEKKHVLFVKIRDDAEGDGCCNGGNGVLDRDYGGNGGFPVSDESALAGFDDGSGVLFVTDGDGEVTPKDMKKSLGVLPGGTEVVFFLTANQRYTTTDTDAVFFTKTAWNTDPYTACVPPAGDSLWTDEAAGVFNKEYDLSAFLDVADENNCREHSEWLTEPASDRLATHFGITLSGTYLLRIRDGVAGEFPHVIAGTPADDPGQWILGWEDVRFGGDADHNDMVFRIELGDTSSPVIQFVADPTTIASGEPATLTWNVTNADTVTIDPGVGNVPVNGSASVFPTQTTVYTLTATGPGGTATASATVEVEAFPVPTITFAADPAVIIAGESSALAWTVSDGDSAVIDPEIGAVPLSGIWEVTPSGTTVYTLTAEGPGGFSTSGVTVTVADTDLTPTDMDISGTSVDSQTLRLTGTVSVTVANQGTTVAPGGFTVLLFEDRNGNEIYDEGTDPVIGSAAVATVPGPGESVAVTVPADADVLFADNRIFAVIDRDNTIRETDETNNIIHSMAACESDPLVGEFDPVLEWEWNGENSESPAYSNVMSAPVVINLNDDNEDGKINENDIPDIVFNTYKRGGYTSQGILRAVSGDGKRELFSIVNGDYRTTPCCNPAAGDIDNDGRPEIVVLHSSRTKMLIFDNEGHLKSVSETFPGSHYYPSILLADIDENGVSEIIIGNTVLDNQGHVLWTGEAGTGKYTSCVADIDLEGTPEVIAGNTAYRSDGSVLWRNSNIWDGFTAIGNFDDDPFPEIVVVRNYVWLLEHTGEIIWQKVIPPNYREGGAGGAPTVADFDGDGKPEIGVAGARRYAVFESDGTVKWEKVVDDDSSSITGSSVFDFEGDGIPEVVYADEHYLRIFRGTDGEILNKIYGPDGEILDEEGEPNESSTLTELPVIADVDNDNNAEIVVVRRGGFRVFGDANDTWVNTRKIWNQHAYHVTNVNDDGTIPQTEANSWQVHNTYRCNISADALGCTDLSASYIRLENSGSASVTLTARIGNGGALHVNAGTDVSFFEADPDAPDASATLLGTVRTTERLEPGSGGEVSFEWPNPTEGLRKIIARADDDGTGNGKHRESDEENNEASATFLIGDHPPEAVAGENQTVATGTVVSLDGTASSDPEGTSLTYRWEPVRVPEGSTATLSDPTSPTPTFTADVAGGYLIELVVRDDWSDSGVSQVLITAADPVVIPDLSGIHSDEAKLRLDDLGLTAGTITENHSPDVPEGFVISQSPASGNSVMPGTAVNLTVSLGEQTFAIPDVTGMTQADAETALTGAGFAVGTLTEEYGDTVAEGLVIRTQPEAEAPAGSAVALTLSLGPWAGEDTTPPRVWLTADAEQVGMGDTVTFTVSASDNAGVASQSLTVDGEALALNNGQASRTFDQYGAYSVVFTATDTSGLSTSDSLVVSVVDPSDTTSPVISLDVADSVTIYDLYEIFGSVTDANPVSYKLRSREKGTEDWQTFAQGVAPDISGDPAQLGEFDPTVLKNGVYEICLSARDASGNSAEDTVSVILDGGLKLGQVNFSAEDLSLPQPGFPVSLVRTYDSRSTGDGDFGPGWNLPSSEAKVAATNDFSKHWDTNMGGSSFVPTYYLIEKQQHVAVIRFSDTEVYKFKMDVTPRSSRLYPLSTCPMTVGWTPLDDTQGSLEALDYDSTVRYTGGELWEYGIRPFEPKRFRLTLPDGTAYVLDTDKGLESMTDVYGRTISYDNDGIHHSSGVSISFERGAGNRIETITDGWGREVTYHYGADGTLEKVVQEEGGLPGPIRYLGNYACQQGMAEKPVLKEIRAPDGTVLGTFEYDSRDRVIGMLDADGNRVLYGYDLPNHKQTVTDRNGYETLYEYDSRGNVTKKSDPLGNVTEWAYDDNDNKLSEKIIVDGRERETAWTYDESGNALTETVHTDAGALTTTYSYDDRNQVLTTEDAEGHITENRYDAKGNLLSTTDPEDNTVSYAYDTDGNLQAMTDAEGNDTAYSHDSAGNMLSETDPLGNKTKYTYAYGNKTSETVWQTVGGVLTALKTTYDYDNKNRVTKTTYPDGTFTQTEYEEVFGKKSKETDRRGKETLYEYDENGNLILTTYPDTTTESADYDAEGNRIFSADRAGREVSYEYDKLNRLTKTVFQAENPDENQAEVSAQTEYNEAGEVTAVTDERGSRTEYGYDRAGRRILVRDALGNETRFAYDDNGNQVSVTDALNHLTEYRYDKAGRRVGTVFHNGDEITEISVAYDGAGRKISETDQNDRTTEFDYDALGRLESVTQYLDGQALETSYAYDEGGNKLSQTDPNNHTKSWEYDIMGRVKKHTLPEGMSESFAYDEAGNVKTHTDFNGQTTTYDYDDCCGRLLSKTCEDGTSVTFTYTPDGQRDTVTDSRGVTDYDYDENRGWLVSVTYPGGTEPDIRYGYDAKGNRTSVETPSGTTAYVYDELNRLETVTEPDGVSETVYTYDAVGNRKTVAYPNGTETEYFYDGLNRLERVENRKSDGTVISSYEYDLGPAGNRLSVTEHTGRVVNYDYDDLYRLVGEEILDPANGNETISYTYDDFGNRLTKTGASGTTGYHYDDNDRLYAEILPDGTTVAYDYDDNGNTLTKGDGTYTTTYSWDAENRLISVDDGVSVAEYEYDADGIRVSAETDGNVTEYLVDKNRDYAQVLEERDADGNLIVGYVYGDDLIRQVRGGVLSYYQYDGQLSVRQLTDTDGNISDDYVYDAFGVLLEQSDDTVNDYLYTGEQFDSDAGFYYLRARYYSPDGGRFVSSDPWQGTINKPLSLNKYLYCYANPVMNVDPSGKMGLGYIAATLGVHENLQKINTSHKLRQYRQACANLCSIAAKFAKSGNKTYEDVKKILGGKSRFQSHHVFQHAVMRGKKNYRYAIGFAIPLLTKVYGKKSFPSPHYASTEIQKLGGKKRNSRFIAYAALIAAGCRKKDATEITLAAENYNEMMGW